MLSRSKLFVVALLVGGLAAANASAATVKFTLDMQSGAAGTFRLLASASAGDNGGISSYGIPLTGSILTLEHRSPYVVSQANFAPSGFSNLRSAAGDPNVFAGQPLTGPAQNYLYGIGQTAGSFASLGIPIAGKPDPNADEAWLAPVVIATGTYTVGGTLPNFLPPSTDLFSNLFAASGNSADKIGADITTEVLPPGNGGVAPNIVLNALGEREIGAGLITGTGNPGPGATTPVTWSALTPAVGANLGVPAIAATLDANGNFSWNPAGSKAGKKGSGNVLYQWTATATNSAGVDTDVAFSVVLIPEPATLSLIGLAVIGFVGVARRRG